MVWQMWCIAPLLLTASASATIVPSAPNESLLFTRDANNSLDQPYWADVVAEKLAKRQSLLPSEYLLPKNLLPPDNVTNVSNFPKLSGFFTKKELAITESTATEVVKKIASGHWSAVEVLEATIKRSVVAQQLFNP